MHHFFTAPEHIAGDRLRLTGDEARHARVLRVKVGETISAADGTGRVLDAVVLHVRPDFVEARVIVAHERRPPHPALVLYQGVAKRERMELVVQKAVEVGARRIVPFLAERTIVRWDDERRAKAWARWSEIARAAAKQCRSPWMSDVRPIASGVGELASDDGVTLVLHEESESLFREALPRTPPDTLGIIVGPEGGLSPDEIAELASKGVRAVTLGERILRTETAGPVALALAAYTYGSLG